MQRFDTTWLKGKLKEIGIFLGWIAGMFLIAGLAWLLTGSLRAAGAVRHINDALEAAGETRKLEAPLRGPGAFLSRRRSAKAAQLGNWHVLSGGEEDRGVVFSIMQDGILAPFLVFISPGGEAEQPVPLGRHSVRIMDRLPPETLRTYISRLEAVVK
jgi:hypothetical protein